MFREKYKLDNESITPRQELLEEIAKKMQTVYEKESSIWKPNFLFKPAFITTMATCCLAVIILVSYQVPSFYPRPCVENPSSQLEETVNALQTVTNRLLESNLLLSPEMQGKVIESELNPLSNHTESVLTLPVYRYVTVDQKKKAKEVATLFDVKIESASTAGEFVCKSKENEKFNLSVSSTGSYTLKPVADNKSETENITKEVYEANMKSFLKKYSDSLNITKYRVEYTTTLKEGKEYVTSAYILNNYNDSPEKALLGFSENISVVLKSNGAIVSIINRQTQKEAVGEFKLMGTQKAIEQYNSGNAYSNQTDSAKNFDEEDAIRIEYVPDANKGVLQPIYIITKKGKASVETFSAVPAIDGQVWTTDNLPKEPVEPEKPKMPQHYYSCYFDFPQNNSTNMPSIRLSPFYNKDQPPINLPVYKISKDKDTIKQDVMEWFKLKEKGTENNSNSSKAKLYNEKYAEFELAVQENGSFTLVGAKKVAYDRKPVYETAVKEFISKYKDKLNIDQEKIEYVRADASQLKGIPLQDSNEYIRGAYIFNHYNGSALNGLLGFTEYIYIEVGANGEVSHVEVNQMQKENIGEYAIITKEQAAKQYASGKAYYVKGCEPDPMRAQGSITLTYLADKERDILQPVYIIEILSTMAYESKIGDVVGYAAVPAINSILWSSKNITEYTVALPNLSGVPDRFTINFFDYPTKDTDNLLSQLNFHLAVLDTDSLNASVYSYQSIDMTKKATEIVKQFNLNVNDTDKTAAQVTCKGDNFTLTVKPNGSYDLIMTKPEMGDLTQEQYEGYTTAFLENNQGFLGLSNPTMKFETLTSKDGKKSIVGVYLFDNQDNMVSRSLGIREYVKLCFNHKGELAILDNRKTEKDLVGAYPILSKSQAIKQLKDGKAFCVQSHKMIYPESNSNTGDVFLLYVADSDKTILQPVYFIELLAASTANEKGALIGYAAVPAVNGKVISMKNLSKESCIGLKSVFDQYGKLTLDNEANAQQLKDLQKEIDRLIKGN